MSTAPCSHLDAVSDSPPSDDGCHECLQTASRWVHLRICQSCGHVGCCDSSPNRHVSAHNRSTGHPLIRSFEPDEDWWWCYPDQLFVDVDGTAPAPSHH